MIRGLVVGGCREDSRKGGEKKSEAVEKGGGKKQETTDKQERTGKIRSWWR